MASSRHSGRVIVLKTLFAYEFRGGDPKEVLDYVAREFEGKVLDLSFACELLDGVLANLTECDALITKHAPDWPVDKIGFVDRAILEIGIHEILHSKDVPAVVALDEAIELAKTFGGENSAKFINGVLNAILKAQRKSA